MSHHQRFSDDILHKWCNQKVRWKAIALLIEITMYENALLIDQLTVCYDLEDAVVDQLVFVYCVFIGETGNQINIEIFTNNDTIVGTKYNHNNKDSTVSKVPLTIY